MTENERRLSEFVDRVDEMKMFCDMLRSEDKLVMVVWGDSGLGKSSLLARMQHECALCGIPKVELVWSITRNHDYVAVMRKFRDDMGAKEFTEFTDLINYFTVPHYDLKISTQGSASVLQGAQIKDSKIGDVSTVLIKDSMLVVPRADMAISEQERMTRLTDKFIECLAAALKVTPRVVFLDAIEKMTVETQRWITGELLGAVLDGRLENIHFVLCGQTRPPFQEEMHRYVEEAELRPLSIEYIVHYLEKRGVAEGDRLGMAKALGKRGNLFEISNAVDSYHYFDKRYPSS